MVRVVDLHIHGQKTIEVSWGELMALKAFNMAYWEGGTFRSTCSELEIMMFIESSRWQDTLRGEK